MYDLQGVIIQVLDWRPPNQIQLSTFEMLQKLVRRYLSATIIGIDFFFLE